MVRCKFQCVEKLVNGDSTAEIKLNPVCCGSKENENFFKWTPWGEFKIGTINKNVAKEFEIGKEYYIDISLVE